MNIKDAELIEKNSTEKRKALEMSKSLELKYDDVIRDLIKDGFIKCPSDVKLGGNLEILIKTFVSVINKRTELIMKTCAGVSFECTTIEEIADLNKI